MALKEILGPSPLPISASQLSDHEQFSKPQTLYHHVPPHHRPKGNMGQLTMDSNHDLM